MASRAHLVVSGRVQGVCYRMVACEEAGRLGVTGWVRNLPNGDVEVVAEGSEAVLKRFAAWCRQGPSFARVIHVSEERGEATGEFKGFDVRY